MQTDYKPKVLYIDDEEENLLVFRSSFRRNYEVFTSSSASEATALLKDNQVDVIISDQRMPDITGVEFLSALPDNGNDVRMILTGFSDIEAVVDALNSGKVYKYISKPWEKEELLLIIEEAIENLYKRKLANENPVIANLQESNVVSRTSPVTESEEIKNLKKNLDEAYGTLQLLNEIGQEITSTFNLDDILNTVYIHVNQLMEANSFGIGIYNPEQQTIDYRLAIEFGKRFKPYSRSMNDKNQFPVWCIENKKEVFINDVFEDYKNYISDTNKINAGATLEDGTKADIPISIIYMPLLIKEKVIGLITVQSYRKGAYTDYHLNNLRNIGIYVATALENAKAYQLIEEQKTEIEHKNTELEQKVEQRTEELRLQKDELEDTFIKLKVLTEIGKEITSTLHFDTTLNTIYENVNRLMDASVFGIGIYLPDEHAIDYRLAIEKGKRYQPYKRTMEDKNQFPVWCIEKKKEVFINDVYKEYGRYISQYKDKEILSHLEADEPLSLIYIPLLFNNQPIGVLSVQSFRKYAYNQYHLDILRSLASYITTAIQNANSFSKMTEAFEQLKMAQSKLVESEKMASLGVLTAGVAHEINNPVNFISGGIQSLKENYDEIEMLLKDMLQYHKQQSAELWEQIEQKRKQLDIEKLLPEVEELFLSIRNGAKRTTEIVKGLRNFSRLDETDKKRAKMEEGLDNTIIILNNRLKNRVTVVKEYGETPELMCFPGQLNQVFLNVLYNAADAIEGKGEIKVKTYADEKFIHISIKDNGSGIPEEIKSRIFEPFFTTKDVGKGTGLGLSIAYGIIEKHNGSMEVISEIGKGTEFVISIPIGK